MEGKQKRRGKRKRKVRGCFHGDILASAGYNPDSPVRENSRDMESSSSVHRLDIRWVQLLIYAKVPIHVGGGLLSFDM